VPADKKEEGIMGSLFTWGELLVIVLVAIGGIAFLFYVRYRS